MRSISKKDNINTLNNHHSYFKLKKINSVGHLKTLQNSRISITSSKQSSKVFHTIVKLQNSFYNDKSRKYLDISQTLSEKLNQYQRKQISFYQRKKYQSSHIQKVVQKRQISKNNSMKLSKTQTNLSTLKSKLIINQEALKSKTLCVHKQKFHNHTLFKYNKLVNGSKEILRNKKSLQKDIKQNLQISTSNKWKSPFKDSNCLQSKFLGKKLISSSSATLRKHKLNPQNISNHDKQTFQLKVLNLDRMFRSKSGKLGNIVPLPFAKLESVNSREVLINKIKARDKIHDVIAQYNNLLRVYKRNTNKVFLGVKGNHYIQNPSIQDLVGIKLRPKAKLQTSIQGITDQVFLNNCQAFLKFIKKQPLLIERLLSGIKMRKTIIQIQSFTRFYTLFVTKASSFHQKINFLSYFFIPNNALSADVNQIKQILEIMCRKLPKIQKLNIKTDLLSNQEKSKIFLQALNRVLFLEVKGDNQYLNRQDLEYILKNNSQAVDLLIKLLQQE